jgi:hypothetical protein
MLEPSFPGFKRKSLIILLFLTWYCFCIHLYVTICMKLDPSMHIGLHLVFFGKTGVTWTQKWVRPADLSPFWPILWPPLLVMLPESSRGFSLQHVDPWRQFLHDLDEAPCPARFSIFVQVLRVFRLHGLVTRPETICLGTSKLACWRVQLSTATKVGRRGAGSATASIEASLLAGDISHPPAQMIPFMLADELCRPPAQKV